MPQINKATIENVHNTPMDQHLAVMPQVPIPTFAASINRRVNLGSFEHLDLAASISLPLESIKGDVDIDILRQAVKDVASEAFTLVAQEVQQRVEQIKSLRDADRGRPKPETGQ